MDEEATQAICKESRDEVPCVLLCMCMCTRLYMQWLAQQYPVSNAVHASSYRLIMTTEVKTIAHDMAGCIDNW